MITAAEHLAFTLPDHLACPLPTELRGIARDEVGLLVTTGSGAVEHTRFRNLSDYLLPGDVLVVNQSATLPAAFSISLPGGLEGRVHFSTPVSENEWLAEIRQVKGNRTIRWNEGRENMIIPLPGATGIQLIRKFYQDRSLIHLWVVRFNSHQDMRSYMHEFGAPIQYENLNRTYPLDYYQTHFSLYPGSAEMPSAARGFTPRLMKELKKKNILLAPILLHTGVSSLEENEPPYPEFFRIDSQAARTINRARCSGRRIIAVGTTSMRAIESTADDQGCVIPMQGHTNLYIKPGYRPRAVNGLLTGFHEPKASHLYMLQAIAGLEHLELAYSHALDQEYYWHQFGDLHLILP